MARFKATIHGSRGEVSRLGTIKSGIWSNTRGWNIGATVSMWINDDGEDVCEVWITHGSNGIGNRIRVGMFVKRDGEVVKVG